MNKVKLLVCYHKKAELFSDDILTPIHVGRANAKKRMNPDSDNYHWLMDNLIGDDTGDNISEKNDSYNEMTALYWAWKNYDELGDPEYIGLMHYRRHFMLREHNEPVLNVRKFDKDSYYDIINYSPDKLVSFIGECDFVAHVGRVQNVYKHFIENQRKTDIDLANQIVLEKYPEYKSVMETYYKGDTSNFCNMFIMKKDLFFEYCEWIFSILEEFENRVDINEKRFFISERLTGLFVANLMENKKYTYKTLPIAFIDEPVTVNIALNANEKNALRNAMAISSIMENSEGYHSFHFYLIGKEKYFANKNDWLLFEKKYDKCKMDFVPCNVDDDVLPFYISNLLPSVNKCIYINGRVLSMFDVGEFFHVSSCDDYYAIGIPEASYAPEEIEKKVTDDLLVLNCKRIRNHEIVKEAISRHTNMDGIQLFNEVCKGQIGYIPWYYFTSERLENNKNNLFIKGRTRGRIQAETLWRPFLIFDSMNPIENNQGVYSVFWWNVFKTLPLPFQKINVNLGALRSLYISQQKEINGTDMNGTSVQYFENNVNADQDNDILLQKESTGEVEDWRTYSMWGKLMYYQKHNGFKNTVKYVTRKYLCGGKR